LRGAVILWQRPASDLVRVTLIRVVLVLTWDRWGRYLLVITKSFRSPLILHRQTSSSPRPAGRVTMRNEY